MLFPRWEFLVCAEGDEYVYMILLPKTERDLLLLNTDLTILMHDLIGQYTKNHIDDGIPIYDNCRRIIDDLIDEIEVLIGSESPFLLSEIEQIEKKVNEEQTGLIFELLNLFKIIFLFLAKYTQKRRQRRDTFTSTDLLVNHSSNSILPNNKSSTSSSPIPITPSLYQNSQHSSSQPSTTGCRRIYSPLTIDTNNLTRIEPSSFRRYSASASASPPSHHNTLQVPPVFNLIPPSPQQIITKDSFKKLTDHQWHIPILLYGCNKIRLASTLLLSNEQLLKNPWTDAYIDCTKNDNESTNASITTKTTITETIQNIKPRKRGILGLIYFRKIKIYFLIR
jgi:hypothetical protein